MIQESVPECSGDEGNTNSSSPKRINPAKRWCFTLPNYTDLQLGSIVSCIKEKCACAIFGRETCPSTGTPHLQGYIEFKFKSRPVGAFGIKEIHWELAKGTRTDNIHYCSKEDKNPFVWNIPKPEPLKIIKQDQLFDWQKDIIQIIESEPDDRKIYWYWSDEGNVGKTAFSKYLTHHYGALCLMGKGADVRNGVLDYYIKNGSTPRTIIYPVPRCWSTSTLNYENLEVIKDMYFYSGKYEGGMVCGNSPHLIVFANEAPDVLKMSYDRWVIVQIDGDE